MALSAAALAAAVTASTPAALATSASGHAAAQAVAVLVPGDQPTGSAFVTSGGTPAPGEHYADTPGVRAGWAKAAAGTATGSTSSASASSLVRRAQLLGGAVRVRKLWTSITLSAGAGGGVSELIRTDVHGLVVLGRRIGRTHGAPIAVGDWGTLTVGGTSRATATGAVSTGEAGLRLELVRAHDGLAAGTVLELGTVSAALVPASAKTAGGSGATPPPPPPRKHHASRHHGTQHHRPARAALDQVGWPYIWGGDSHSDGGFDCSGLVDYAYARAGLRLPGRPTAAVLFSMSTAVGRAKLQPGDLAFLYSRHRAPYHVALYAGGGLVVVAPEAGADVQVEPLGAVHWDGYGRLLAGGRGGGLARSVAAAARRYAHPSAKRLAAARRADALAAERAQLAARLRGPARVDTAATATSTVRRTRIVALASVAPSAPASGASLAGAAVLVLVAAACLVRVPALRARRTGRE